ncbi:hypothetical protein [Microbacterium lacus]|uniref:hypothetical protein n=1 Tax=Microbacterium lacus TaxID=415217 RepID=UPI0031DF7497
MTDDRGNYGFRSESVEDPQELRKIADFRRRIRQIPLLLESWQKLSDSERLADSQLALDDEFTAWRHLSSGVNYSLNFASDNLRMLHQIHREDAADPLPFVASYPLARSALEAGALAHWVLAPDDPRERVARHLRNAARELFEETSLRNYAFELADEAPDLIGISRSKLSEQRRQLTAWRKKHSGQIAECASRIGITSPVGGRRVGFADIVGDATEAAGLARWHGVLVWMQISGLTHPSLMRAVSTLAMTEERDNSDGTVNVLMTSTTDTVSSAVIAAVIQFRQALTVLRTRKQTSGDRADYRR